MTYDSLQEARRFGSQQVGRPGHGEMQVRYRILGPLEVESEEGSIPLGSPKQRALLGVLLLHGGDSVSVAALTDHLWGDSPPRTAEHSIQAYVSGMRGVIGAERIGTTTNGYQIVLDGDELDLSDFERLNAEAATAEQRADTAVAYSLLSHALQLWRGDPLSDVDLGPASYPHLVRLTELRLQVMERWARAALACSQPEEVIAEMERATRQTPLRESLWALRMRALDASGRTAEALRVYQDLRRILGEEMGIEPSPELKELEESLLLADARAGSSLATSPRNPYKGLRPFGEEDAADFFGRDSLLRELIDAVADPGRRLISVIGPSGSGKSSVVRAGLIPALKAGALPGSEGWSFVVAQPGHDPDENVRVAIAAATGEASHTTLWETLSALTVSRQLILVLDQFEELFTQTDETTMSHFLDLLTEACDLHGLRLVVTLRADFYDRPLLHPRFGRAFAAGVVHVHPLSPEELEAAARGPAGRNGVDLHPALISELLRDVAARPGSLPLFQYALTEVFEHRHGDILSLDAYRATGGVSGALIRRAEDLFERLSPPEQATARQVFYRLVAVGEADQATRRRVTINELENLGLDVNDLGRVLDLLGHHRLLSFDREPTSGVAMVEVVHEALLAEWPRLRLWLEEARSDLRRRILLTAARDEWDREGQDSGFLLAGNRLSQYEEWADKTLVALTTEERNFVQESIRVRDAELATRREEEEVLRRAHRRGRLARWGLALSLLVAGGAVVFASGVLSPSPPRIAAIVDAASGELGVGDLSAAGLTRAEQRHEIQINRVVPLVDAEADIVELCLSGTDLILVESVVQAFEIDAAAAECQDTTIALTDIPYFSAEEVFAPNLVTMTFRVDHGSYLAGAAAALSSQSGVVGFVGGVSGVVDDFLDGYAAGARAADPNVEVLSVWTDSFDNPPRGRLATQQLLAAGADVVYHAAGPTGDGVLAAITDANDTSAEPIWFIGVDVDEGITAPPLSRRFVLTSMVKRVDLAVFDAVGRFLQGELDAGLYEYGLDNGGVELADSGNHLAPIQGQLDDLRARLTGGLIEIPSWRTQRVEEILHDGFATTHHGELELVDGVCTYSGPVQLTEGDVLGVTAGSGIEAGIAPVQEGAVLPSAPSPIDEEPIPELDLSNAISGISIEVPVFEGSWWFACLTSDLVYPGPVIEVASAG